MNQEERMQGSSPLDRVRSFLQQHDPSLRPLVFDEAMHTSDQAARVIRCELAQIAKSIVFKARQGYGLFVLAGDRKVKDKVVKAHLGAKPRIARPDEVALQTGFQVGAVCPFALKEDIPVFVDSSLRRFDLVYTAAGVPESLLPITFDKLVDVTAATVIDLSGPDD